MRRTGKMVVLAAVLLAVLIVVAYAASAAGGGARMGRGMMGGGRGGGGRGRAAPGPARMGRGMGAMAQCPFHTMMGTRSMVAAPDGVYVMVGDELLKYDHNLNLQKETEIKIDWPKMAKRMMEMHEKCPICHQMMSGRGAQPEPMPMPE
jgi:hypothetical protein